MAETLLKYYKYVSDQVGLMGQVKLAQATLIPSTKAAMLPDSKDNVDLFKKAVEKITGKTAPVL